VLLHKSTDYTFVQIICVANIILMVRAHISCIPTVVYDEHFLHAVLFELIINHWQQNTEFNGCQPEEWRAEHHCDIFEDCQWLSTCWDGNTPRVI
jgi:hypothetical protein